jgi:hypothetical protein
MLLLVVELWGSDNADVRGIWQSEQLISALSERWQLETKLTFSAIFDDSGFMDIAKYMLMGVTHTNEGFERRTGERSKERGLSQIVDTYQSQPKPS